LYKLATFENGYAVMEQVPEGSSPDLNTKLTWEIRKLQAEVDSLRRPLRNPSVIAALMTASLIAIVSLGGLALQWSRSDREFALAQIKTERLELDSALLERKRAALDEEIRSRNGELVRIRREITEAGATLHKDSVTPAEIKMTRSQLQNAVASLEGASRPWVGVSGGIGASPSMIAPGEISQLRWNSFNATHVEISPGIGAVPPSGSADVSPKVTTTYTLTISNSTGSTSASATVQVLGPRSVAHSRHP
jgi:hypothetical protein